ncbi:hypothetical protein PMZ80_009498 [Knufia obscura]|uniref:Uncharacterized protein n=2 Tax=Knufia TaxID=430999 RepID=A0AAN8I2X9_9EURO|nr:hypothetical protein PMZ80_009498 [Knufia obscura]KAK5949564.1 hypothetical protein OHC33_009371 [Knufia fluminis]
MPSPSAFRFPSRAQAYTTLSMENNGDGSTTVGSPSSSHQDLPQSEKGYFNTKSNTSRRRLHDVTITIILTLLLTAAFQYTYHTLTFNPTTLFHNAISSLYSEPARLNPQYHCGNSSTEARQLGCIFDLSLVGWVPAPCFEPALNQRFLDFGWRFFEDQNGTIEVSLDRIAESAGTREPFWAQHGYHVTHCELAWERMHMALQGGKRLTTHALNLEHTRHCAMMMELRDGFYSLNSQILPLLNSC